MTRTYPPAERTDVVDDMHGHKVLDPYRWLEDADDARTQEWGEQQFALLAIGATGRHHQNGDHGSQGNRDSDEESEREKRIHAPIVGRRVFTLRPATVT